MAFNDRCGRRALIELVPQPPSSPPDCTPTMDERDFVADSEEEDNLMDTGMQKDPMNWQEEISTCESWLDAHPLAVSEILQSGMGTEKRECPRSSCHP